MQNGCHGVHGMLALVYAAMESKPALDGMYKEIA